MGCKQSVHGQEVGGNEGKQHNTDAGEEDRSFHEQYQITGKLGRGNFAQVHLAYRLPDKDTRYGVKIWDLRVNHDDQNLDNAANISAKHLKLVQREVDILKQVGEHPHCVQMQGSFLEGAFGYIILEYCAFSLLQALEGCVQPNEQTYTRIFSEMLKALRHIHEVGVVHRDVKPDNFLCTKPNITIKLCDFGLSEVIDLGAERAPGIHGTAPFMSPEICMHQSCGTKTDVWSLGVTAYAMFFGQFPYQPAEQTNKSMTMAIIVGLPKPRFSSTRTGLCVSRAARSFVRDLLRRDELERPTAEQALQHLWFTSPVENVFKDLRTSLQMAKRIGAFERPIWKLNSQTKIDVILPQLQAKYHKEGEYCVSSPVISEVDAVLASESEDSSILGGRSIRTDESTAVVSEGSGENFSSATGSSRSVSSRSRGSHHRLSLHWAAKVISGAAHATQGENSARGVANNKMSL